MPILSNLAPIKVFWYAPAPLFAARVNMPGAITYPIQDIPYDGVTVGSYTDCHADMFFTLGSAAGLDDYGRGRLRAVPTADTLKVGRSSQGIEDGQLNVVDNAYITVYFDFRVHAKIPVIGGDYNEYKDTDIAVSDLTEFPPPICNMGGDCARSIDAGTGTITVFFPGSTSIPVATGATITTYSWEIIGNGTFVNSTTASSADVYIEFEAGVHLVRLTITDSNGKQNTGHRLVLADDPANSLCIPGVQGTSFTRNQQGVSIQLHLLRPLPRADYPDGGHILVWEDRDPAVYGEPLAESRDHMRFTGWHQTDQASSRARETHLQRDTTLTCVDVLGRMDSLPGFHQRLEVPTESDLVDPGMNWGYMPAANMDKFLAYLLHWHSTAGGVADFFPSGTWEEYPFVLFDAGGDTLYSQLQRQANRIVPDYNFTSDRFGAMRVVPDPQLQNPADRTSVIQNSLTYQGVSEIEFGYQRPPRVHTTRGSALLTQTEWLFNDDDEKQLVTPVFSIAPGTAPGQGAREVTLGERLAKSQADLNDCVGHHHARSNARYGLITGTLNLNSDPWDFDPAAHTWVQLLIPDEYAPQRGMDLETVRCLPKEVTIDYTYGEEATTWRGRVQLERETVGLPALTEQTEEALPVGEQPLPPPVTVPPDSGLRQGQENVVGVSQYHFYRTADFQTLSGSGGPTWTRHDFAVDDSEEILSWVVDPFSPGYLYGAGTVNGWVATPDAIVRVSNLFGTLARSTVLTFPTAIPSGVGWRTIQASFGAYFAVGVNPWLICVSYYGDTPGHTGTWATYSVDGGVTWNAEVQVSAHYDTAEVGGRKPIGVYCSPKTPGLAYTAAYTHTEPSASALGFVSEDWGATWTVMSAVEDPDAPLVYWGLVQDGVADTVYITTGPRADHEVRVTVNDTGVSPIVAGTDTILMCPPANAVRVHLECGYGAVFEREGGTSGGATFNHSINRNTSSPAHTQSTDLSFTSPAANASTSQNYFIEWSRATPPWPGNRDTLLANLPGDGEEGIYCRINLRCAANSTSSGTTVTARMIWGGQITEVELDDGTIYIPGSAAIDPIQSHAGAIHLPWPSNPDEDLIYYGALSGVLTREFQLRRATAGIVEDIGPVDSGINYGVNHYGFSIRSYDSDRQFMALGGIGNSTSDDAADDKVGLWKSANGGDSWTNILAPVAASNCLYGLQIAFGGDDSDVLFAWGGLTGSSLGAIYYSDDFGVTLDSRQGNLATLEDVEFGGAIAFVGIAGGIE